MADHNGTGAESDYDRIGGGPAVRAVVERFYELVLADADLAPFFVGVDMSGLKRHQALLISQVLGGPAEFTGRELRTAHAGLAITAEHFGAVVAHLVTALTEAGAPPEVIARVGAALGATEKDIVTQPVS
ncbi:group I truncated hemoglobin [Actinopolymorpha singaporensis]|uniref:Group 1 truncated hemoglobin n=1 Tax=Actinopolymorpha singaporensis TaxID=117157 RepID=A0A1H1PMG4_9ACTN|nr:group 1 truncated hemoglobin [Actinopolymorpha singaporensis]SDS12482.1 hemoglobin [Actinopolymorpha singaporensis]